MEIKKNRCLECNGKNNNELFPNEFKKLVEEAYNTFCNEVETKDCYWNFIYSIARVLFCNKHCFSDYNIELLCNENTIKEIYEIYK